MDYHFLGDTGIKVSKLCFGALVIGPLQKKLGVEEGAAVIEEALQLGVNFIDTADLYGTYPHIKCALERSGKKPVICSKCYSYNREDAKRNLDKALTGMGLDSIDLFLMHEQESEHTIRGHWEAFEYYLEMKQQGIIKAVGISTHHIAAVEAAARIPEMDVIHPITNKKGLGICDGDMAQMLTAIQKAYIAGKGIYGMKAFGGGNLLSDFKESLQYVLNMPFLHAIAVGMQSIEEVRMNVALFENINTIDRYEATLSKEHTKALHVDFWCEGCGKCVDRCNQGALSMKEGHVIIDKSKCVLCGYCSSVCPAFALKVY